MGVDARRAELYETVIKFLPRRKSVFNCVALSRNRDSPYIGHIIAGNNINDQITWYTSILYSLHGYDLSPNPEIVIT